MKKNRITRIKWLAIFISLVLWWSLTACGKSNGELVSSEAMSVSEPLSVPEAGAAMAAQPEGYDDQVLYQYEIEEQMCENDGSSIYGMLFRPLREDPMPLVIISHGLADTHEAGLQYAHTFAAQGIGVYIFDFCGGGDNSQSDGATTEMSVMTEVSDLEAVLAEAQNWEFVDTDKIVLLGCSQGGAVTAIVAARHEAEIAGQVLCYPGFLLSESIHELFATKYEIPDTYYLNWLTVGRVYFEDLWDYDIYKEIGAYQKKVLILHGDKDDVVNVSWSQRALGVYEDAQLYVIKGAGHGFHREAFDAAYEHIKDYFLTIGIMEE